MNITESVLINILRAFIADNEEKPNIDGVNMRDLFFFAKKNSVIGMVAYTLAKHNLVENPEHREKFNHEYERTLMAMISREASAALLCRKLHNNNIEHILFKGMMVSETYPVPALRTYGDVDIIVREQDIPALCEYMMSEGYKHSVADAGVVNVFEKDKEHYEFHKNLNVSNLKDTSYFEGLWNHTIAHDKNSLRFDHNFHLCYLITHLEKHVYGSGAGIRMYMDIVLYINKYRDKLDLEEVRNVLTSVNLGDFLNTVLFVCNKWFALEVPEWVKPMDDELYEKMCEFTFSGGVFGDMSGEKNVENALRQNMSNSKKTGRIKFILSRFFPPFYELSRMYPRYNGKPYLAPVAWVNHLFVFFKDKKYRRVKVVASADASSASEKKEFLESIGSVH